jgi:hypothetical protein
LRWPVERYQKARSELVDAGLIRWDDDASVVMITRWFKFSPPMNEKHWKGIRHILERLPSQSILAEAIEELEASMTQKPIAGVDREADPQTSSKVAGKSWAGWRPRPV